MLSELSTGVVILTAAVLLDMSGALILTALTMKYLKPSFMIWDCHLLVSSGFTAISSHVTKLLKFIVLSQTPRDLWSATRKHFGSNPFQYLQQ